MMANMMSEEVIMTNVETKHKDCAGRIISIGDQVATNDSGYTYSLVIGEVLSVTAQKVKIRIAHRHHTSTFREIQKFPEQLCLVR